jgi:hypothetical protein
MMQVGTRSMRLVAACALALALAAAPVRAEPRDLGTRLAAGAAPALPVAGWAAVARDFGYWLGGMSNALHPKSWSAVRTHNPGFFAQTARGLGMYAAGFTALSYATDVAIQLMRNGGDLEKVDWVAPILPALIGAALVVTAPFVVNTLLVASPLVFTATALGSSMLGHWIGEKLTAWLRDRGRAAPAQSAAAPRAPAAAPAVLPAAPRAAAAPAPAGDDDPFAGLNRTP